MYCNDLSFYVHSGLGSIIECVKAGTHNTEALYLCEVCGSRLGKADIRNHIMGSLHRYNYIVSLIVEDAVMARLSAAWGFSSFTGGAFTSTESPAPRLTV